MLSGILLRAKGKTKTQRILFIVFTLLLIAGIIILVK